MNYATARNYPVARQSASDALWVTYRWMTLGLAVTGFIALAMAHSQAAMDFLLGNRVLFYGLLFGQLGLVFAFPQDLRDVYLQFGLDLPAHNGDDSWELPMPARLVVDRGGLIRDLEVDPDYTVRPEPEATLAALERLG